MSATPPASAAADPDLVEALAHAKRRRAALERLSVIGMELAEQIGAHASAAMAAINEPKVGDPTRPFATLSRAIRLTLALEARVDAQILALRKGRLPAGWAPGSCVAPRDRRSCEETPIRAAGDPSHPARENLVDRETFEGFEPGGLGEAVAAIRADPDLEPDEYGWLDDEGFANYDTEPECDEPRFRSHDLGQTETRRRRLDERRAAGALRVHPPPAVIPR